MAKVTVIIPFYNAGDMVQKAVTSALAQSYPVSQVICVDDGSTDGTGRFLERIGDTRLIHIRLPINSGKSVAMNAALNVASGDYLLELDADDWLPQDAVEYLVNHMNRAPSGVVGCYGDRRLWRKGRRLFHLYGYWRGFPFHDRYSFILNTLKCPPGPRFLVRDAVIYCGGWCVDDPSYGRLYEDYRMWLRLLGIGDLSYCPHYVYEVWRRPNSSTQTNVPLWEMLRNITIGEALKDWEAPVQPIFSRSGSVNLVRKRHNASCNQIMDLQPRVDVQIATSDWGSIYGVKHTLRTLAIQTQLPVSVSMTDLPTPPENSNGGYHPDYMLRLQAGTWLVPNALEHLVAMANYTKGRVECGLVRLAAEDGHTLRYAGRLSTAGTCVLYNCLLDTANTVGSGHVFGGITEHRP